MLIRKNFLLRKTQASNKKELDKLAEERIGVQDVYRFRIQMLYNYWWTLKMMNTK